MNKFVPVLAPAHIIVTLRGSNYSSTKDVVPIVKIRNADGVDCYAAFDANSTLAFYSGFKNRIVTSVITPMPAVPIEMIEVLAEFFAHAGIIDLQDDPCREQVG